MSQSTIIHGDALTELHKLTAKSVQCCVTSPPYHGLRDYGVPPTDWPDVSYSPMAGLPPMTISAMSCCLGMEPDLWAFIGHIVLIFRGVRHTLKDDGTLWLNMGDAYASIGGGYSACGSRCESDVVGRGTRSAIQKGKARKPNEGLKPKDLTGQPWRVAFALQADGWYLRSEIIWHKRNPMPESVQDRPTKAHEQLFLFSKSLKYFYDAEAIKEPAATDAASPRNQWGVDKAPPPGQRPQKRPSRPKKSFSGKRGDDSFRAVVDFRNKRTVWTVGVSRFSGAHFATFPPELARPCIMAGTKHGDTVLDPFAGSGTTGQVALELGRSAVLVELGEHHIPLIRSRVDITPGLPL